MSVRVLLAEDQAMVRGAIAALLALEDIEIVAEASRGDEVVALALESGPEVALLDVEMPGGDGLDAAAALREKLPSCRVIILTTFGRAGSEGGATIEDVAARLYLSEGTVRNYLSSAIKKLETRNRVEAARLAQRRGWL